MRKHVLLGAACMLAAIVGLGLGLSTQDSAWFRVLNFVLLLVIVTLLISLSRANHLERERLRAYLMGGNNAVSTPATSAPRRDADIIRETYGDGKVTLHGPAGSTITGTSEQIGGLASEMDRRRRGDRPQFKQGEQVNW